VDEAHRLTPTAASYYQLGQLLSRAPRLLFLTATPHRGKEFLFRALMHLVDPDVFPSDDASTSHAHPLKPGRLHFIRRMKEELLDYDGVTPLFKGRRAQNLSVPLNATETTYYSRALAMVDEFFPPTARTLAGMVYGKRTASSLHALRETLRRRRDGMGSASPVAAAMENDGEFEDETAREEAAVVVEVSLSARAEREAIAKLLKELEHDLLDADMPVSKWPRIQKDCLAANGILPGGKDQAVVFTEYADTADWLVRRFRAAGYSAERYSGRDHPAQRELIRGRFARREFQVIVSTDAGNEGIDLQTAHVLVNWDIPWSLVRLEQRMGRIHRVGQDRDVELFNLVAAGTREGEALHVLLTNFVVAANQLDGKLFDSLSVVAELINLDVERELRKTYQGDAQAREALATVRAATVDRVRAAAQRGAAEEDALRSRVDLSKAVEMLQAETLERINPRIVESFLARLQGAGLVAVQPHAAGEGLFSLSVTDGRALPGDLGGGRLAFVATSSNALDVAAAAGADVTKAVRLGPGHPAFLALIGAARDELRPLLYRGAELSDPTSVTDYYLCAYEADVTELGGQRIAAWVCLVRVDDTGARRERWETLANLEAAIDVNGGSPHPGRIAEADDGAGRAAASDEGRRQVVLSAWLDGARRDLERLPMTLTADVDPDDRPAARRRIQQAVDHRLADLTTMAQVSIGTPRRIGWTRVKALGTPSTQTEIDSEVIAMTHVTKVLRSSGWRVADVHLDGRGYDLHALRGQEQRCIEVKGIEGLASSQGVVLTGNELLMARQLARDYWLYVVDRCTDGTGSFFGAYRDPAVVFEGQLKDVALLRLPGSALKAARAEIESA
jgi:superfamily II DNA or RNA helicase